MSMFALVAMLLYPLLGVVLLRLFPALRDLSSFLLKTAAVPAALAVLLVPPDTVLDLDWLFLGARFELTDINRIFLMFTALLWVLSGWYAARYTEHDPQVRSFTHYWLLSLAGNLGVLVSGDIPGFYSFFALMTFAAYGLVVHGRTERGFRAGRAYIALAVLGEVLILCALFLIAGVGDSLLISEAMARVPGSESETAIIALVLAGFGVKTGLLPLHGWLPLAHPVAPTPASAVLSGSMIKAGLIGWLTFLPGGLGSYPHWGAWMIALGSLGAFYAAVVGILQTQPKTVLAYSSISQMGIMTLCVGIGLSGAADWPMAQAIVAVYALNHAFAKGALFLGVGVVLSECGKSRAHRLRIYGGLSLAALTIAGAPMTGGSLAKRALKYFAPDVHPFWGPALGFLLPLSALLTTLLLARFLYLLIQQGRDSNRKPEDHPGLVTPWILTLLAVAFMAWWTVNRLELPIATQAFTLSDILKSAIPVLLGLGMAGRGWISTRLPGWRVPAGDIGLALGVAGRWAARLWARSMGSLLERSSTSAAPWIALFLRRHGKKDPLVELDSRLGRFEVGGMLFILGILLFAGLLLGYLYA